MILDGELPVETGEITKRTPFARALELGFRSTRAIDLTNSREMALGQSYEDLVRLVNQHATSSEQLVANPYMSGRYDPPGAALMRRNQGREQLQSSIFNRLRELERQGVRVPFTDRGTLEALTVQRVKAEEASRREELSRATALGTAGGLLGSLGGGVTDPINAPFLFIGAGASASLLRTALIEGSINTGIELLTLDKVNAWRRELGLEEMSEAEAAAIAFAGGAGFAVGARVAGRALGVSFEAVGRLSDRAVVRAYRNLFGRGRTPEERAALSQLEQSLDLNDAAPAPSSAEGRKEHVERTAVAGQAINNNDPIGLDTRPDYELERQPAGSPVGTIQFFKPEEIEVDADLFQFKAGGDAFGVTDRLAGVTDWDPVKAGLVVVYEFRDGRRFIADGHQRLGLAKRIRSEDPSQDVQIAAHVLREEDGISPAEARVIAASKNIAEGTGTAVDAAKVLRVAPEQLTGLPPRSRLVQHARGLVNLSDDAFRMVVNEVVPENFAAIVGRLVNDPELQPAVLQLLARTDPANEVQAESVVRQALEGGATRETQETLFGEEAVTQLLFIERAKVLDRVLKELRRDRQIFRTLTRNAEEIEAAGNKLNARQNQELQEAANAALAQIEKLAHRKGRISEALTEAARRFKETGRLGRAADEFKRAITDAIGAGELDGASAGGGRGGARLGDEGAAGEVDPQLDRLEKHGALFDEPGGEGQRRQTEELEAARRLPERTTEELQREEAAQERKALLDDLAQLLERNPDRSTIDSHPAVIDALERMNSIPPTVDAWDLGSDTYWKTREFNFPGGAVVGVEAALDRLIVRAKEAAFRELGQPPAPIAHKREMTIILGPPAAGKSSIANPIAAGRRAAIVDPDDAKRVIPEFSGGLGSNAVHEESSLLSDLVLRALLEDGANIVFPKVGADPGSIRRALKLAKDHGYRVELIHMEVSAPTAYQRMIRRFVATGRLISPKYMDSVGERPRDTYNAIKEEFDGYAQIDNEGAEGAPKPIREEVGGEVLAGQFGARPGQGRGADAGAGGQRPESATAGAGLAGAPQERAADIGDQVPVAEELLEDGSTRARVASAEELDAELEADSDFVDQLGLCLK